MSSRFTRLLESASNVAVVVVAVVLVVVLVRHEFPATPPDPTKALQGRTINLAALTSAPSKRNLVLAISQTCHFCEREMPFYRRLGNEAQGRAPLLVVFPAGEPAPEKFLAERSVRSDRTVSASFVELGLRATPTLLLVD